MNRSILLSLILISSCTSHISSLPQSQLPDSADNSIGFSATPTFSPVGGIVDDGALITISGSPDSVIYYTTDGSTPSRSSDIYTAPISVNRTTTIKAFAVEAGYGNSTVVSATYNPENIYAVGQFNTYNGVTVNGMAKIKVDGSLDTNFNVGGSFFNNEVYSIVVMPDGKPLMGGYFTTYNLIPRPGIVRLNTDGSLDESFDPGTGLAGGYHTIAAMVLDSSGRAVGTGGFTAYNVVTRQSAVRVNTDGSPDTSFDPGTGFTGSGFYPWVSAIAAQADGKILAGGEFTTPASGCIARLNTDGSVDTTFNPWGTGASPCNSSYSSSGVWAIAVQTNGSIVIGGGFTFYNDTERDHIARINTDGTLDITFDPGMGANGGVESVAIQPDGKILIGGDFTSYNGIERIGIARINTDGTLDSSFDPGMGADSSIYSMVIQSDGKIIIAGDFTHYNGVARDHIARLNADGSLDASFLNAGTGTNTDIFALAVQAL